MMYETIHYTPTQGDLEHLSRIRDFLTDEEIPYQEDNTTFGLFILNDGQTQVRYINSSYFRIDNTKKFGVGFEGVSKDYFWKVSRENHDNGIRTIWVFDFEMEQVNAPYEYDGVLVTDFHRQWEVIKNTIRTACGKIHYRFYARDCEVREIPNKELRPFLNTNCFYGYRSANKNLGLYLKKDKNGLKAGTLLFCYTFGMNFYGNKKHQEEPRVEVIRAATRLECQVVGGISKCIKYFCENYPTLTIGGTKKEVEVDKIVFYVDASHNDSRGMTNSNSAFHFVSWEGGGFINMFVEDTNQDGLVGKKGEVFMRRPMYHKQIMKAMREKKIVSIGNAGTIVFEMSRKEFLNGKASD